MNCAKINTQPSPLALQRGGLVLLLICLATFAAATAQAQVSEPSERDLVKPFKLTVDVPQVVIAATVTDKRGAAAPDLTRDNFEVFDDSRKQRLAGFGSRDEPVTIGIVLDNSRSMAPRRQYAISAVASFVGVSNPQDEFFVVHFNDNVRFGLDRKLSFSSELTDVRQALMQLHPEGMTALYDAVSAALDQVKKGRWDRTALLIVSDGADTASKAQFDELLRKAGSASTPIYAIGIYDDLQSDSDPKTLRKLADISGGKALFPKGAEMLPACKLIAHDIRQQYMLSYTPTRYGEPGSFHDVKVKLLGPDTKSLRVRCRTGYYEPLEENDRAR